MFAFYVSSPDTCTFFSFLFTHCTICCHGWLVRHKNWTENEAKSSQTPRKNVERPSEDLKHIEKEHFKKKNTRKSDSFKGKNKNQGALKCWDITAV